MKRKFYGVLSLKGVDENCYKRILVTDMCIKEVTFFLKFLEVSDTHTSVCANS